MIQEMKGMLELSLTPVGFLHHIRLIRVAAIYWSAIEKVCYDIGVELVPPL